ncbi:MAG: coproporphyrinogen III oxidase, partial [Oscillospiraceae bacterium]
MQGIYIHIPFCDGKCPYCDFYSQKGDEETKELLFLALLKAIETYPSSLAADTIYFGGGTPSLMGEKRLLRLVEAAVKRFSITENPEITLEAN